MPKTCRFLLVRLQMERDKLIGWAILAKVSEHSERPLSSGLKLNRHTINDALREMQVLLLDVAELKRQYNLDLVAADVSGEDSSAGTTAQPLPETYASLEQKAVRLFDKTRRYPKRLKWAAFDKDNFEKLLANVGKLNEAMMYFLESHDRERHFQMQEVTFMQILHVNRRMDDLFELFKSFQISPLQSDSGKNKSLESRGDKPIEETRQLEFEARARSLARFKAINIATEDEEAGSIDSEISLNMLVMSPNSTTDLHEHEPRSYGTYEDRPVWIEWRYYEPVIADDSEDEEELNRPPAFVENRISKMAKILHDSQKPAVFRVPDCLGYIHDPENTRLGFVFTVDATLNPGLPISLYSLLSNPCKPSLTIRIKIALLVATSIWYLHSTDWVHKGLRSENIIFQTIQDLQTPSPILCGFDYSRPAQIDETTERVLGDPLHELYRHPKAQFDVPREGKNGFKKRYDVYSLGVVLFEIGVWRPIHGILGIDPNQRIKSAVVKSVQSELLLPERINILKGESGDTFAEVVTACLSGDVDATLAGGVDDIGLQLSVWEHVIKRLESIVI